METRIHLTYLSYLSYSSDVDIKLSFLEALKSNQIHPLLKVHILKLNKLQDTLRRVRM